jgi:hypothetical protein
MSVDSDGAAQLHCLNEMARFRTTSWEMERMHAPFGLWMSCAVFAIGVISASAVRAGTSAVEFYNSNLDEYFVSADQAEISALENGIPAGWLKTGYAFSVSSEVAPGYMPVCRFFSASFPPKSSHFYTAYADECASLKLGAVWKYESIAFYLALPSESGTCLAGHSPIYRLYNNGLSGAPNHRYTSARSVVDGMKARGWIAEGNMSTEVFACGPPAPTGSNANTRVYSTVNSRPYDIAIRVPDDYDQDSAPLPVIYALDAQIRLPYYEKTVRQTGARVILVQIYDMGARVTDDILPGALAFHQFLTKDLFEFVDANYRVDPTRRTVSGLSLAGEFPIASLYLDAPGKWHFSHYHIVDWGAYLSEAIETEQRIYDLVHARSFPVTLIFARGASPFSPQTNTIYSMFANRNYADMQLYLWAYPTGHVETDTPALVDLLGLLCGGSKCQGLEH